MELVCVECERTSSSGIGWRAYITGDPDEEPDYVVVYCPSCAAREFDVVAPDEYEN